MVQSTARRLAYRDSFYVIWAFSQYLQTGDFDIPSDVEVAREFLEANPQRALLAEWTLEEIAREVIQYSGQQGTQTLRQWGTLAQIANVLRDLEGEIYARLVGPKKIHLELMRISHRQFVWQQQRPTMRWIIRYYKIFSAASIDNLARQATGLTINEIYLIGLLYIGMFLRTPFAKEKIEIEIPGLTQAHIDRFLGFTSLEFDKIRKRLRSEQILDEGFAYRYSSLREYPLVKISHGGISEIACPIPTLLFWRITTGLYYSLRNARGFSAAFGQSFQDYVGEVLRHRISNQEIKIIGEREYMVGRDRKDTVDWIVSQENEAALFAECKTMRLTWASKTGLSDPAALEQDIRKLAGAVIQIYRTIADYRENRYPNLSYEAKRRVYPVVVTLEDWYFFGAELPVRLEAAVKAILARTSLPSDWLEDMPYSVMSVDEFETVAGIINTTGIQPFMSGKALNKEYRYWTYDSYYKEKYRDAATDLPALFEDQYDAIFAGLIAQ